MHLFAHHEQTTIQAIRFAWIILPLVIPALVLALRQALRRTQ